VKPAPYTIDISHRQRALFGVYVHVPFCPHLCPYCDFVKTTRFSRREVNAHFASLQTQLELLFPYSGLAKGDSVTLYFGGGTPGLFPGRFFEPLISFLSEKVSIEECTIEANPHMPSRSRAKSWIELGINRVTLGVQSLDPSVLAFLGRRHSERDVLRSIELLRSVGFTNIQVDLIYGLPDRFRGRALVSEVETLARAGATGLSSYALTVEGSTIFADLGIRPCDDSAVSEYEELRQVCASVGWERRETSNFSASEIQHNNLYWYGHHYLGLGTGAHGFLPRRPGAAEPGFGSRYAIGRPERLQHSPGIDALELLGDEAADLQIHWDEPRTLPQMRRELVYSLLRTPEGIPGCWLKFAGEEKPCDRWAKHPRVARGVEEGRLIADAHGGIRLGSDEFLLGDLWCREILQALGWDRAEPPSIGGSAHSRPLRLP
jgi:oxygen-independent coproporphyrinogen-3 oxidase